MSQYHGWQSTGKIGSQAPDLQVPGPTPYVAVSDVLKFPSVT